MTKKQTPAGYDRRAIMRDAHKRFRDGRLLDLGWTFAQCLRTAWAAARIRQERDITATMNRIASMIEDHLSRRIVLPPAIGEGMSNETDCMGFRLLCADNRRRMADGRRAICRHEGAR